MSSLFRKLNEKNHTFIIAEAGSNWKCGGLDDDINQAKKLISLAAECGADAIKFQTFRANTVYVSNAGKIDYLSKQGINQNISEIFDNMSMPYEMIPELADFCAQKKIMFMSTPFSVNDAEQVNPFVSIHKIASFEINHIRLLEYIANTHKPVLISTGASNYNEIDFAVNLFKKQENNQICLLQCTSKYPAPLESLNLSVIPKIKMKYDLPIGFSDHSVNPIIGPLMAIGYGATVIEKHFTLDKNLPGPDHSFALSPEELDYMIKTIRLADQTKGEGEKIVLDYEMELFKNAKRAIQATKDIEKGDILKEGVNIDILRPGNQLKGLDPRFLEKVNGKKAKKNIKLGEGVLDYEESNSG